MNVTFRLATHTDITALAEMNVQLIRDEGHRNRMSVHELADRMESWLRGSYEAVIFSADETTCGYALYRNEPEWVYLRQFFVLPNHRRHGIGRAAMQWLFNHQWRSAPRVRLDVLVGNSAGLAFWRAVGFEDYCITLEMEAREEF